MMSKGITTVAAGGRAEQAAAEFLVREGYEIVERNFRRRHCEIDIVAHYGDTLYMVEVKYRATYHFGGGFEYIGHDKLHRMARAAETFVAEKSWNGEYTLAAIEVGPGYAVQDFIQSING